MNTAIHTDHAPAAIGPYSQAVLAGDTIYVSGQIPIVPEKGELIAGGIEEQTRQSLTNISNILAAASRRLPSPRAQKWKLNALLSNNIPGFSYTHEQCDCIEHL